MSRDPNRGRNITCPQCGATVRIPWFWTIGIEGIFRCRRCKLPFKTGYKMGAILSAVSLSVSMAAVQLLVYVFSSYSMILFALLLVPLWIYTAFRLRRAYMIRKIKRRLRIADKQRVACDEEGDPA